MTKKNMSRSDLAQKAGISKARLSQLLSSEANPTTKTFARLFHALGEEILIGTKPKVSSLLTPMTGPSEWEWQFDNSAPSGKGRNDPKRAQLVAVVKEAIASNDNYHDRVIVWELGNQTITLKAA